MINLHDHARIRNLTFLLIFVTVPFSVAMQHGEDGGAAGEKDPIILFKEWAKVDEGAFLYPVHICPFFFHQAFLKQTVSEGKAEIVRDQDAIVIFRQEGIVNNSFGRNYLWKEEEPEIKFPFALAFLTAEGTYPKQCVGYTENPAKKVAAIVATSLQDINQKVAIKCPNPKKPWVFDEPQECSRRGHARLVQALVRYLKKQEYNEIDITCARDETNIFWNLKDKGLENMCKSLHEFEFNVEHEKKARAVRVKQLEDE